MRTYSPEPFGKQTSGTIFGLCQIIWSISDIYPYKVPNSTIACPNARVLVMVLFRVLSNVCTYQVLILILWKAGSSGS